MKMEKNVGSADKKIRFILGLVFLTLGYMYSNWWYVLGVIALFTSFSGFCILYKPFKINTIKKK